MPPAQEWFNEARYGMFVHWGAYAVAGRGEWVRNRERIPQDEYIEKYVRPFKAERYDPAEWAKLAVEAGMKYVVLTTRHHDGFCLWDTKTTDFNAVKLGPERDLVRPFADAMRAAGLKVGFYYSFADWHHADYPDPYARDWPSEWHDEAARLRFVAFYRAQLEELMTNYGPVDILWYDGCIPGPTDGAEVNTFVKTLQPNILINERNGPPYDFEVSEQVIRAADPGRLWEANLTLNDNWGYHPGDLNYKSAQDVVRMLLETAEKAGNLLLNVGPRPDGVIPPESVSILREAGGWLRRNGEFLPNSSRSPFSWNCCGRLTTRGDTAYVHLFHCPGPEFCIAEIGNRVRADRILATGEPVTFVQTEDRLFLTGLPVPLPDPLVTTIALELGGPPQAMHPQTSFWMPQ